MTQAERLLRKFSMEVADISVTLETAQEYIEKGGQENVSMFCDYLRINGLMYNNYGTTTF